MMGRLISLMLAKLASPAVSFLIIILIAKIWGKEDLGAYNTILAWLAIFQFLAGFGVAEYISREIGKDQSNSAKYLTHGLLFSLVSSIICVFLMVIGVIIFRYPEEIKFAVMIASLSIPFMACILVCQAVFTAYQKIKYITILSVLENLFILIIGTIIIFKDYGLYALVWCIVLARFFGLILNFFVTHKYICKIKIHIEPGFLFNLLSPIIVFGLTGLAFQIFMRVDVLMLSKMKDMIAVGLYSSASKLTEICLMLPLTFYVLNLPVIAKDYTLNSRNAVYLKIEGYSKGLFILIFFLFGFLFYFAEALLLLLYGQAFAEAVLVLRILMIGFLFHSAEMILGMSSQAAGYHTPAMYIAIFRAISNVILNFIFIPKWGPLGAAMATLTAIFLSFILFHFFVKKILHGIKWLNIILKPAIVCLFVLSMLFLFAKQINMVFSGLLYVVIYGLMIYALTGFPKLKTKLV